MWWKGGRRGAVTALWLSDTTWSPWQHIAMWQHGNMATWKHGKGNICMLTWLWTLHRQSALKVMAWVHFGCIFYHFFLFFVCFLFFLFTIFIWFCAFLYNTYECSNLKVFLKDHLALQCELWMRLVSFRHSFAFFIINVLCLWCLMFINL